MHGHADHCILRDDQTISRSSGCVQSRRQGKMQVFFVLFVAGIVAKHVDGSTGKEERAELFSALREEATSVLSSVGTLSEGTALNEIF